MTYRTHQEEWAMEVVGKIGKITPLNDDDNIFLDQAILALGRPVNDLRVPMLPIVPVVYDVSTWKKSLTDKYQVLFKFQMLPKSIQVHFDPKRKPPKLANLLDLIISDISLKTKTFFSLLCLLASPKAKHNYNVDTPHSPHL
ncbi:hypothetical protein OUZ56_010124 [Daphnia magna]|uniref:Uncharacterized protein n=1 Tax=Daphnia magna TaxID=35525 RepID=A0ABR0AHW1_9CRUS|nr:hypothetical protein OUZ56_010124 [Daphnia magna]